MVQLERPGLVGVFEPPGPAVTLVCAPAGFGKTTVVREWFDRQDGSRREWVAVDAGATGSEVTAAVEKAMAALDRDGLLVVDGLTTPEALAGIEPLAGGVPGRLRLIVTSRARPTDDLARLVALGGATLVSEDDLTVDLDQAVALVSAVVGRDVPVEAVEPVVDELGGWVAGLATVARGWQRAVLGGGPFPNASTDAAMAQRLRSSLEVLDDYAIGEVLGPFDAEVRALVAELGHLPVLAAELANQLLGRDDSASLLSRFRSGGGMVTPGEKDGWLVVHDALRGAVRRRLHEVGVDRRAEVVDAAAEWYIAQGEPILAIRALGEENRWDVVLEMVKDHVPTLLRGGYIPEVARVLRSAPHDVLLNQTRAVSQYAFFEIATGSVNRGLQVLNEFERLMTPRQIMGANIVRAATSVALADPRPALLAGESAMEAIDVFADDIESIDADYIPANAEKYRIMVGGHLLIAGALTGEWRRVHAHRRELPADVVGGLAISALVSTYGNRAAHLALAGELVGAAELAELGLEAGIDGDLFVDPATACARFARGMVAWARGDWRAAIEHLVGARDRAVGNSRIALAAMASAVLAQAMLDGGDLEGAAQVLADAPAAPFDRARTVAGLVAAARARICFAQGDPTAALVVLGGVRPTPMSASEHVAIALRVQDVALAESVLAQWPVDPTVDNRVRRGLAVAAHGSVVGSSVGTAGFGRTVGLAATHGLVQPVARLAEPLAPLLRGVARKGRSRAAQFCQSIVATAPAAPLPGRQLAVMQLLEEGLTLPAIAAELHISASMVKKHTRAIYKALGVTCRAEAVQVWSAGGSRSNGRST